MTAVSDFTVGDRVEHSSIGPGIVTMIDSEGVHVLFDKKMPGPGSQPQIGIYSANWFRIAAATLTKRATV